MSRYFRRIVQPIRKFQTKIKQTRRLVEKGKADERFHKAKKDSVTDESFELLPGDILVRRITDMGVLRTNKMGFLAQFFQVHVVTFFMMNRVRTCFKRWWWSVDDDKMLF